MRRILDSIFKHDFRPNGFLTGKLLVTMPFSNDLRFTNSVIYLCGHDNYGAIGLVINKGLSSLSFGDLLNQLNIPYVIPNPKVEMHAGGPVDVTRGFVLHSLDYLSDSTVRVGEATCITATLDILRALASGRGPSNFLLSLGYVGWGSGQLEQEIQDNHWMIIESSDNLIFDTPIDLKWKSAMASIGIKDISALSMESGRA